VSDHFNGDNFYNYESLNMGGYSAFFKWRMTREPGEWQEWAETPYGSPPLKHVNNGKLRITVINHATTLIQMDDFNILTDPIWSERASPFPWIGPKRVRAPGIRFDDLPPIDIVIISHNHYDHLDLPTLKRLYYAHKPLFIVGLGNAALLQNNGIKNVKEIDWWRTLDINPSLNITGVPARHFSMRGFFDIRKTLWTGYVLEGKSGNIYFAGDSGYGKHFKHIYERFGSIRLALLPIGAYLPLWYMGTIHLSPDDAVNAHYDLNAMTSVAIHYGTFELGDDGQMQASNELNKILKDNDDISPHFWILEFGEGRDVP